MCVHPTTHFLTALQYRHSKVENLIGTSVNETINGDSNANILMATAINLANQAGLDGDKIIMEMRSGDYINLVKIFDKYFGKYVILETTNEELLNA